ncbi:site-specific DNA-methyltransferase [Providencia rettgeri]|uniref:site-specific DNA-methyltransferase n=1 Tax=Morganellaceae TaxID=1903414 RepID=UPI0029E10BAD|nr:site-specific DNA-methyltransferase [Proteus mirabilis]
MSKTKLELTWIGKDKRPKLEPRILLEDPELSYHASHKVSENDIFDNKLIFGDNLLALKALEQEYTGKVKCIFIDPPYNTGVAFEHYDDGLEHSLWLSLMRDRLELIRRLLSEDGSLWITIDDNESHYLKVLCDEVFGRNNFISNVVWEKSDSPRMDAQFFSGRHDHVLVYSKNNELTTWNRITTEIPDHYNKLDEQGRRYYLKPLRAMGGQGDSREARPTLYYPITAPDGTEVFPIRQDGTDGAWRWTKAKVEKENDRIDWIKGRNGWTVNYRIYAEETPTRPPETIWFNQDVGTNRSSKAEVKKLAPDQIPFGTPKPEKLLERIIHIATNQGDIVLDSFAGSGTTGAVAHKMGRRWIMVELGEHCHTHIIPRLQKVIDGEDQGGISKSVNWQGGGGFRYYKLAPSLIEYDRFGQPVINKEFNAEMLAEAVCKLEGFTYAPSDTLWWQHGYSTETDFIYVTTQNLSIEQLEQISEEVGSDKTLLVMCGAFRCKADRFANLTIKKLPKAVLKHCEWAHDDYSLNVQNLPMAARDPEQDDLF